MSPRLFKVALATVGCKVNQYETQVIRESFKRGNYVLVPFTSSADIYIINTCTVTHQADEKSRALIRKALRRGKESRIIVTGCYSEAEREEIKQNFPQVEIVPLEAKLNLREILEKRGVSPPLISSFEKHTRAFIKVEDGCNQFCSYCCIPYVRGEKIRSRPLEEIKEEVENLLENGFKEIVLGGINLGLYGRERGENLLSLLKEISSLPYSFRIRLSSLEPNLIDFSLLELISSSPKICPHLHLPLQSGSNRILKAMNRKYTQEKYLELVQEAKRKIPSLSLTTDVMVGFPGEEEKDFEETLRVVEEVRFLRLHIFRYSPRPQTSAHRFKSQLPEKLKRERSERLKALGLSLSQKVISSFMGKTLEVLVEGGRDKASGLLSGYSENYIRVIFEGPDKLKNKLVRVRLLEAYPHEARGVVDK